MANICNTEFYINGDKETIKKFDELISKYKDVNDDNSIEILKIAKDYDLDKEDINLSGLIFWYKLEDENTIHLEMESKWSACADFFVKIKEKLNLNLKISYCEVEPGCEIFNIHDENNRFTHLECCVDILEFFGESTMEYYTFEQAIENWFTNMESYIDITKWNNLISINEKINFINDFDYSKFDDENIGEYTMYKIGIFEKI